MRRLLPLVLRPTPPPVRLGLLVAAASVVVETVLAYPLERVAHASSLGVYLLGVVAVSTLWGVRLGAPTAVVSVLTWNYFYAMPGENLIHTRDWLTLVVFLGVALPAGWVADLARSRAVEADARRQEADLAAELAHLLLRTQDLRSALPAAAQRLAQTLELPGAVIELDTVAADEHHTALPLHDGTTRQGTLLVPADLAEPTQRRLRERIVPSLEALLHAACERQTTGRALETSRDEQRLLAEQQAALRRVATLVARGVSPTQVFAAVAEQIGQLLDAEFSEILRYGSDGAYAVVGSWTRSNPTLSRPLGSRWPLEPGTVMELLSRTEHPARIQYGDGDGVVLTWLRENVITSAVACPIVVEGSQWGAVLAGSTGTEPQPADTEERMLEFTELVATAIANTESRTELRLLAEQQAALRRVATLVARGVAPTHIFAAVAGEMGQILHAEFIEIVRYETDRAAFTVVGTWTRGEPSLSRSLGSRWPVQPGIVVEVMLRTEQPARIDFSRNGYGDGEVSTWLRENGITSAVGCPIIVQGRQWGAMVAFSTKAEPQPADTEERMREFTELVAAAIANTESRTELRLLAEQQAALRRVATLVARGVSPTQLFRAVAEQMGQILEAEFIEIARYETDRAYTVVGSWTRGKPTLSRPLGSRWSLYPGLVGEMMLRTGRPARLGFNLDGYGDSKFVTWAREQGITSAVGCPIVVEGRQWGAMIAFSTKAEPQPADTEERMREFTELVATAIANTESRTELIASRARVVAAADQTRRRIERDLHDGTQQRLLALALNLRAAEAATPPELDRLRAQLTHTTRGLAETVTELQEISRGIHPANLSNGGIAPALKTLARRSAIPVELTINANQRLSEPVEVAAYYIVSEALTNTVKHAHASVVHINLDVQDAILRLRIRDDGDGGADPNQGSGLTGLRDRVEALNGTIEITSPTGDGTSLTVTIPTHNDLPTTYSPLTSARRLRPGRAGRGPAHARTGTRRQWTPTPSCRTESSQRWRCTVNTSSTVARSSEIRRIRPCPKLAGQIVEPAVALEPTTFRLQR